MTTKRTDNETDDERIRREQNRQAVLCFGSQEAVDRLTALIETGPR